MDNFFSYGSGLGFMLLKWIHFLAGITWIGVLYYFNFIQGQWFKEIEDQNKEIAKLRAKLETKEKLLEEALTKIKDIYDDSTEKVEEEINKDEDE